MITLREVTRWYGPAANPVRALDGVSLAIARNEFVAVTGPSGCGKSTLLHLLGALDSPTSGEVVVDGVPLHTAGEAERTEFRRHRLGMVFQFFHLLPTMNVLENVCLPLLLQGVPRAKSRERAERLLGVVGLSARTGHFVHQLSGGEMQRAALARALVHEPALVLADEPTGNLDSENEAGVLGMFREIAARKLTTIVLVTHSEHVAATATRQIRMRDGRVEQG